MSSPSSHQLHPASVVTSAGAPLRLYGKRIVVRPLTASDFEAWSEVRHRNGKWLSKWEPIKSAYLPDPSTNREAFNNRCIARDRERQSGGSYAFGIFIEGSFAEPFTITVANFAPGFKICCYEWSYNNAFAIQAQWCAC